jgi:hypothetical protein
MTDTQLYLAIGLPTLALVLGMIGNGLLFNALSARMNSLESRMSSLEAKMDLLIGKVADMDTRLSILEDRSQRG